MRSSRLTPRALARHLFTSYAHYRLDRITAAQCRHQVLERELTRLVALSDGLLRIETVGRSIEGRTINLISSGSGRMEILLWSQMHGDESTATLALMDMFHLFVRRMEADRWVERLMERATIRVIPMLNPDGAERMKRQTAVNIDMNRDALALATPEAKVLRAVQRRYVPAYGFNLHDQAVRSVGTSTAVTAIALLAPPVDPENSITPVRRRAMRVAAIMSDSLGQFADGHIARYDDSFEPRAFGDNMQRWGTSTVLMESGHWPHDREKTFVRKLNVIGILSALWAIATGAVRDAAVDRYTCLSLNGMSVCDILVKDLVVEHPDGWSHPVDVALTMARGRRTGSPRDLVSVKEIGDLRTMTGLEIVPGRKRRLMSDKISVDDTLQFGTFLTLLRPR